MELPTYIIILVVVIIIIFTLVYILTNYIIDKNDKNSKKLKPVAAGLVALVVAVIIAAVMAPYITYTNCNPIVLFKEFDVLSCSQAQNLVLKIAAIAILTVITLLVIQALITVT